MILQYKDEAKEARATNNQLIEVFVDHLGFRWLRSHKLVDNTDPTSRECRNSNVTCLFDNFTESRFDRFMTLVIFEGTTF